MIRTSRRRPVIWAIALVVLAALLAVGLAGKRGANDRPAPALPSTALVGRPLTLAALLGRGAQANRTQANRAQADGTRASGAGADSSSHAGGTVGTAGGRAGGHAALVIFWASWCEPCQHEAPAVERFAQSPAGRGRVLGVDYGESELSGPRAFLRRYRWSFPVLLDPDARAGEAYGVTSLPNTFAIDARGRIVQALRGPQTEQSLAQALAAANSS